MYNPDQLKKKAQLNIQGVNYEPKTSVSKVKEEKDNEQNWLVRGVATAGNIFANVLKGATKSIEGIVDAGAMAVGIFGVDVDDFVEKDLFGSEDWFKGLEEASYLDNDHFINQVADGIGGMLPSIAVGFITGGTSLAGTAASAGAKAASIGSKIAQTGTFVAGAMGNASEYALQDGANYDQALGYGALSGGTEGVIEALSSGIGGTKMGTVLGKQIAKKTGTKLATTFISEGLEEVASDLIDPHLKKWTGVDEDAKVDTNNLFRTFVLGGSIGAVMGVAGRKYKAVANSEIGGEKFLKIADEVSEIEDSITAKESVLSSEKKTQIEVDNISFKVADDIGNSLQKISNNLKLMTEEQRLKALQVINSENSIINNLFDTNGEIKTGVLEELELSKKRHYSANSILKSEEIKEELSNLNQEKGWNLEIDDSQINENERTKLAQFYAVKNGLSEKTGKNLNFVMVKGVGAETIDGFYSPNGKTIYITKDTLNNSLYGTTTHEVEHFVDNPMLQKYLINSAKNDGKGGKLLSETVNKIVEDKNYGVTKENVYRAIYKKTIGQKLSQQEALAYSELTAHLAENLLGNEEFIKRLARSNRGIFNKVKNYISDKLKSNSKSERYRMAEYLFDNALKEIKEKETGKAERIDNSSEMKYAKKGYAERNPKSVTEKEFDHHYWAIANNLLSKEEIGVLNSLIGKLNNGEYFYKNADGFYMIPVGENGVLNKIVLTDGEYNTYSIDTIIEIALNNETELSIERENIYASESKGIQTETNEILKVHYSKDYRFSDFKGNVDNGLRDSNGEQNGARSDRAIKLSLKDSQGRTLNKAQQDFFKDSKVVDENGNLRVVYHGTVGEFYTFDKTYLGSATGVGDAKLGFFFTSSENVALEYAINAHDAKFFNLAHKIANGDNDKLKKLLNTDGYKEFAMTKDVEELGILKEKGENFEHDVYEVYLNIKNPLVDDWHGMTYRKAKMLKLVTRAIQENYDGVIIKNIDDSYDHDGQISDVYVIFGPNQVKFTSNKNPSTSNDMRFSYKTNAYEFVKNKSSRKITANMSEQERYELLKDRVIENVPTSKELTKEQLENIKEINSYEDLNKLFGSNKKSIIRKIADEFGAFKGYYNKDIELEFDFSKGNYNESYQKQKHNFVSYAKMFSVFDEVIENAVGIEVHNRNKDNYKFDPTLKNIYVLASAFIDEKNIVPIKLEVKEFKDKDNRLYVAIALNSIKKAEVLEDRDDLNKEVAHSSLSATISIRDLLKNVNPKDESFYKYIPKQFFEETSDTNKYSKKSRTLTDGQVKKKLANYTNLKVYSKTETEKIINTIIEGNLGTDSVVIDVSGKTKNQAIDMLWNELNTAPKGKQLSSAFKLADYIVENSVVEDLFSEEINAENINTLAFIRPYLHNVDLTEVKSSINARGLGNSVYALWSNKEGLSPYQIKEELESQGFILEGETDAEAFFDMLDKYTEARQGIQKETKKLLKESVNAEELKTIRRNLAVEILESFDKYGKKSKLSQIMDKQKELTKVWKNLYLEEKQISDAEGELKYQIEKFKDVQTGKYLKASDYKQKLFEKSIGQLKKLVYTGKFNDKRARLIMGNLKEWYTKENPLFANDENFNEDVARWMGEISENIPSLGEIGMEILERLEKQSGLTDIDEIYKWYIKANLGDSYSYDTKMWLEKIVSPKKYTALEIYKIAKVVGYFRNFLEKYRKLYVSKGVYEDAMPKSQGFVDIAIANKNKKMNGPQRIFSTIFQTKKSSYAEMFVDPMSVARFHDGYNPKGYNQYAISQLQNSELELQIDYMNIMRERDKFFAETKYAKRLSKAKVTYQGKEISLNNALEIYTLLNEDDAVLGFAYGGLEIIDTNGNEVANIEGFANENDTIDEVLQKAKEIQRELEKQFTKDDMQYIAIQEHIYNVECRKRKEERDNERLGYSNVKKGYYHPIWRADVFKGLASDYTLEMGSVNNASFNKERTKSQARLVIMPSSVVLERHVQGVLKYYHYSPIETNLNIIRSLNVAEEGKSPLTLEMTMSNWKNFSKFYNELYKDMRGVKEGKQFNLFSAIRGNTAKAVLGLNPKVLLNQLSSFPASIHILDVDSLIKGLAIKSSTEDLYKYAPIAEARKYDSSAAKSQGVIEDAASVFLKGIGYVDGIVVKGVWGACQYQIEKDKNLKVGTEANKKESGELLKRVILETQQNTFKSSQTQASRSNNDLLKMLVMFRSDIIKGTGRLIDSVGRVLYSENEIDKKTAWKQVAKSSSVILIQSLYLAGLSLAFSKLYNTDDEESDLLTLLSDAVGNLFGGLPIIGSFIDSITSGYDVEDMSLGSINDMIDSIKGVAKLVDGDTDSREIANTTRKAIYSISSFLGLPVKNLYKIIYGGVNVVSPSSAYQMDNLFYNQSYKKDLTRAIENNDEDMISTIAGLIMNENVGAFENKTTRSEVDRLITAGYDVLPQSVGSSMTIDGETYTLTENQKQDFKKIYNQSIEKVDALVSSKGYKIASDEAKAKAIKYIYKYYFYEAQQDLFDVELDNKLYLFGQILPIEKMALALAEAPIIAEKSTNKKSSVQAYLQGSKLTAIQKYILMGYFGYKNTYGESQVKALISKTNLSKKQREILLEKCGY